MRNKEEIIKEMKDNNIRTTLEIIQEIQELHKKEDAFNKIVNNILDNEKCVTETDIKKWVAEELENINWDNTVAVIKQINELCSK